MWMCNFSLVQSDLPPWANSVVPFWDRPAVATLRTTAGTRACSMTVPPDHVFRESTLGSQSILWVNIGTMWTSHFSTIGRATRALFRGCESFDASIELRYSRE